MEEVERILNDSKDNQNPDRELYKEETDKWRNGKEKSIDKNEIIEEKLHDVQEIS